jgi:RNA polymerase sigma-70 factor (ECF subfamily)
VNGQRTEEERQRVEAFNRYVLGELDLLLRVAVSKTLNRADAEDLVQETLFRAYRAIDSFDGRQPRSWLLTIMRNAQINEARRRRPSLFKDAGEGVAALSRIPDPQAGPEEQVVDYSFDSAVAEAFYRLPEKFRQVVRLVDIEALTYREAADALGVAIGTIMSRLHRGRARIKQKLQRERLKLEREKR